VSHANMGGVLHGWRGAYMPHAHLSAQNIANAVLAALCLAPSIWATLERAHCEPLPPAAERSLARGGFCWCEMALAHPLFSSSWLFFWNVTVGFWLVGCAQRSFWLIDPFWTLLPPLIGAFYASHPDASPPCPLRLSAALVLVCLWSARLTHSYFRREEWKFGQQEDWRYTAMAEANPLMWWVLSFFAVGLAQQPMLLGLCLPLYAAALGHTSLPAPESARPWGLLDLCGCTGCLLGLLVARAADDSLSAFMAANKARVSAGKSKVLLLESGLWNYSRHPNYLGETLFWSSLGLFGCAAGHPWTLAGAAFNTLVLVSVTYMTEAKMCARPERRAAYERYIRTTSCWILLPKFRDRGAAQAKGS